jgi:hypothetical protein
MSSAFEYLCILYFDARESVCYLRWSVTMSNLYKDILIGLLFIIGMWSFVSGEFIISTVLFASAAIFSNVARRAS